MDWTARRKLMRDILSGPRALFAGSVYDGISARIADSLGFEVLMLAGSVASFSTLAAPDLCVLTLSEFAEQAYRINRAAGLPLLVDADHGYGNALNVKRTVEELETAGVSALTIEDTALPLGFGSHGKARLLSIEEGIGKMKAALAGRQDPGLAIVARTSAVALSSVTDAIDRLKAYEALGVDALFVASAKSSSAIDAISQAVKLPLILGEVPQDMPDKSYLEARNVKIYLQGHHSFWAAVNGYYEAMKALRAGTSPEDLPNVAPAELRQLLIREAEYKKWETDFL